MSIIVNAASGNPALDTDTSPADDIIASPALLDWFEGEADYVTQAAGKVTALISRGGSAGKSFSQASTGKQALLTSSALNGCSELTFSGAQVYTISANYTLSDAFTWIIVYKPRSNLDVLFGNQTSTSQRSNFESIAGANALFAHGNGTVQLPHTAGSYNLAIMGHDGATLWLSINGGAYTTAATDNNVSTSTLVLGGINITPANPFVGGFSDLWIIAGKPTDNADLIDLIKTFVRNEYGLTIA